MGQSTNAILAYGYHLDGSDDGWSVNEIDDDGHLSVEWLRDVNQDADDFNLQEAAWDRLLAAAGFAEEYPGADGDGRAYYGRKRAAEKSLGVEFVDHCSGEYPMLILAAKEITVYRGSVQEIDPLELAAMPGSHGWDQRLSAALAALGITPKQERPAWLLCSYWG